MKRILILLLPVLPTLAGASGRQGHMTVAIMAEGLVAQGHGDRPQHRCFLTL